MKLQIAAAAAAVVGATALIVPMTGAQTSEGRRLTVQLKFAGSEQVTHGKPAKRDRLATGDAVFIRSKVFSSAGAPLGWAYLECVNAGPKAAAAQALLSCTQTYKLADGQIVTAGVIRFDRLQEMPIPIVGGSGAYRGARGQLTWGQPAEGFDSVDILNLDA
jgi:hypothetical protein